MVQQKEAFEALFRKRFGRTGLSAIEFIQKNNEYIVERVQVAWEIYQDAVAAADAEIKLREAGARKFAADAEIKLREAGARKFAADAGIELEYAKYNSTEGNAAEKLSAVISFFRK